MSEYVAFDNNVEVLGVAIQSNVGKLGDDIIPVLESHGLYPLVDDQWYPIQNNLDCMKELASLNFLNIVAVGMGIPEFAAWPPEINSVHDALASINVAYHMNHRGGDFGDYQYEETGESSGTMTCRNPYPSDLDYGIIYGIVRKFRPVSSTEMKVVRDETIQNRTTGGDTCIYYINW